jgi:L-amino acid N-acyltransferase YncA
MLETHSNLKNRPALQIRPAQPQDFPQIHELFKSVMAEGDSYTFPPDMSPEAVQAAWMGPGYFAYVACEDDLVLGTYTFHVNHPGRGSHVANASYLVSKKARGKGLGKKLGEHSLITAKEHGFQAMQFNIVVSTNEPAVRLWLSLGFAIVGTVPQAFQHPRLGLVDIYVMHRFL